MIFVGAFLYGLIGLVDRKGELILMEDGIKIKDHGFNHWEYVSSISIEVEKDNENGNKEFLLIWLKDGGEIRCNVTDLDHSSGNILHLARTYKNNSVENNQKAN